MVRTPERNYLRVWREFRQMTQAQLAEAVGTTGAVISLLEAGHRGLSDKWLRKLAVALNTRPGHLLEVDPHELPSDILEIWNDIPREDQDKARAILKAFGRTANTDHNPTPPTEGGPAGVLQLKKFRGKRRVAPSQNPNAGRGGETPEGV